MMKHKHFIATWKVIIQHLPYKAQILLRGVSKAFIRIYSKGATLPALTTQDIRDAERYLRGHRTILKDQANNDCHFSISASPDSQDKVIGRLISTMAHLENDQWVDDYVVIYSLPIKKVKEKAALEQFKTLSHLQYAKMAEHHQRSQFIAAYLALPSTSSRPRSRYLENQSIASLERLILSLKRRHNQPSQEMLNEVNQLILSKQQEASLSNKMNQLSM